MNMTPCSTQTAKPVITEASLIPIDLRSNPNLRTIFTEGLKTAIRKCKDWEFDQSIDISEFEKISELILTDIDSLNNAYHNREHTEQVMKCVQLLVNMTKQGLFSDSEKELCKIAALFHDYEHCGHRYRQKAIKNETRSNEEVAAISADNFMQNILSTGQRIILQGLILSTSFGQSIDALTNNGKNNSTEELLNLSRPYKPHSNAEKLLAFADIGRFILGPQIHFEGSLHLLRETKTIPSSFEDWIQSEKGFIEFVANRFDEIKDMLTPDGQKHVEAQLAELKNFYNESIIRDPKFREQYNSAIKTVQ